MASFILLGCSEKNPQETPAEPPAEETSEVYQPSAESLAAARYYRRLESSLLAKGLLRTDGGGIDTQFTIEDLNRDFERITFFSEYQNNGGRFIANETASNLRRWRDPIRLKLHFGASAPETMQQEDSTFVERYVARLSRLTGHDIELVKRTERANFHVFVVSMDEQRELDTILADMNLGLSDATIRDFTTQGRSSYCFVYASSVHSVPSVHKLAVALVRTEHPDLMRQACYHEEIAQGLGLANDSPEARPSIFNDDEEFAFLTEHDEFLLTMLYDERLQPGMSAELARPIFSVIAEELMNSQS